MPVRLAAVAVCFANMLIALSVRAQSRVACSIPPAAAQRFQSLPQPGAGVLEFQSLGMDYIFFHCPAEARQAFLEEQAESASLPLQQRLRVQQQAQALLAYTAGWDAYLNGDTTAAMAAFADAASVGKPMVVQLPATEAFAMVMTQHFDADRWPELQEVLRVYEGEGYWKGRLYLAFCGLTPQNAQARIAELRDLLQSDLPTETRLTDQVILAGLLVQTGRLLEADLLTRNIEPEFGRKVLAPDLRVYFLQICLDIAGRLAAAGDPDGVKRAAIFQQALRDINSSG